MTYSGRRTGKRALGHGLFGISARSRRSRWHGLLRSRWSSAFSKTFSNRARKDDECATHSEGTDGADGGVGTKQGVVVVALRRDLRLTALDTSTNMRNGGFVHSHQERLWRRMTTQIQSSQFVSRCKVAARFQSLYTTWRGWAHVASQQQWWRGVRALAMRIVSFKRVRKADVQWAHDLRLLFMCMGRAASGGALAPEPPRATGSDQSQGEFWQQKSILVDFQKKISCVSQLCIVHVSRE